MKRTINFKVYCLSFVGLSILMSSCSVTLPSFKRTSQSLLNNISINTSSQILPLSKEEYQVIRQTTGKATSTRFFILFIPIGKHKNNDELLQNSYYNAIDNLPNADALLLARHKFKRLTIPLILFTYDKREFITTGVGISIKGKPIENLEQSISFDLEAFNATPKVKSKKDTPLILTNKNDFYKYFTLKDKSTLDHIDFKEKFMVAIIGKSSYYESIFDIETINLAQNEMKIYYKEQKNIKGDTKKQATQFILIDKVHLSNVSLKKIN